MIDLSTHKVAKKCCIVNFIFRPRGGGGGGGGGGKMGFMHDVLLSEEKLFIMKSDKHVFLPNPEIEASARIAQNLLFLSHHVYLKHQKTNLIKE